MAQIVGTILKVSYFQVTLSTILISLTSYGSSTRLSGSIKRSSDAQDQEASDRLRDDDIIGGEMAC